MGECEIQVFIRTFGIAVEQKGIGKVHRAAPASDSAAEVDVFHVHEKTFIKEAYLFENRAAEEHETA